MLKPGMGLRAIQRSTRHASIETLVNHYIRNEESVSPYFDKFLGRKGGVRIGTKNYPGYVLSGKIIVREFCLCS
jgi:hypothetical protein